MKIEKNTKIGEIVEKAPEKVDILLSVGMHCLGCPASQAETLESSNSHILFHLTHTLGP